LAHGENILFSLCPVFSGFLVHLCSNPSPRFPILRLSRRGDGSGGIFVYTRGKSAGGFEEPGSQGRMVPIFFELMFFMARNCVLRGAKDEIDRFGCEWRNAGVRRGANGHS
jgi:hypothetical protein